MMIEFLPQYNNTSILYRNYLMQFEKQYGAVCERDYSTLVFLSKTSSLRTYSTILLPFALNNYRIKFVPTLGSSSGNVIPASLPACMDFKSQAIFLPKVRIVCIPSKSCCTSSGVFP